VQVAHLAYVGGLRRCFVNVWCELILST